MRYTHENDFNAAFDAASAAYGVPVALLKAIAAVESQFNPTAKSAAGAIGLMQVLPSTAGFDAVSLRDPIANTHAGAKFLSQLLDRFDGDTERAVSAYNGGDRPNLGFGTRYAGAAPLTVCLAWKRGTVPGSRTIARDCAQPHTVKPGEFGNAPYVDKVMSLVDYYAVGASSVTAGHSGAPTTAPTVTKLPPARTVALGVVALVIAALAAREG